MAEHAKLSASGASRWINCPGSVALEENFEDTATKYTEEGTLAHSVAELKLRKYFVKGIGPKTFKKEMDKFKDDPHWQKEMDYYTDIYVDEVKKKALEYKNKPFINIEERVDFSKYVPYGFGTADMIIIYQDEMTVMDLKYGKGVPVSPEDNPQLMLYALGAYEGYKCIFDIKKVNMCIVQPRLEYIEYSTIKAGDLVAFGEKIKPIAEEAFNGSNVFKTGEHCRFCKAKGICSKRAEEIFAVVPDLEKAKNSSEILSNDEIGELLFRAKDLIGFVKDLESEALKKILNGEKVKHYKAVEGRSNRKIIDEEKLAKILISNEFKEEDVYKPKELQTLTALEKLVGKSEFAKLAGDLIEKPQGKPTLVLETDKRKDYVKDVSKMFDKVN